MIRRHVTALSALALATFLPGQDAAATYDKGATAAKAHWAFQPLQKVAPPVTKDRAWPRTDIDRFVRAAMTGEDLTPGHAARPHALLRRLAFDLTGLPPTAAMRAAIAKDSSPEAFDRLADQMLASPEFGERWGRHWLDVARFAESSGGGRSLMFKHAWRFRDYVIDAYNADRPFDVFVREQVAGDLLPWEDAAQRNRQLVATGFLELGAINYELQDKERLRMEVVDEQISTVGSAFLAMTLGCARCHDHKFDPIPTKDYYALAGIFQSTQVLTSGNVSGQVHRELEGADGAKFRAWEARVKTLRAEIKRQSKGGARRDRQIDRSQLVGIVLDDRDAELVGEWKPSVSVPGYLDAGYLHDADVAKGEKRVVFTPDVPKAGRYEVRISYTSGGNRATNAPVVVECAEGDKRTHVNQRRAPGADGFVSVGRYRLAKGRENRIIVSNERTDGHVIVDAVQLIPVGTKVRPTKRLVAPDVKTLRDELARLLKNKPPAPRLAMAVRDVENPADGHVHLRGLVRKKGDRVRRGFLTACGDAIPEIPDGQSGRAQLADWLTRPDHPLTTRVYVNRVWHHLFGSGLVRTTDNFGVTGERPSHPELLDWLARRFMADGWSTKKLVRAIVRSNAYRLAVANYPAQDPENRLLSVGPRRRLDAEALRDAILTISGDLDRTRGGSTIRKFSQYDYDYRFDSKRRSVYVPRFRAARLEVFDVFDAPDPSLVTGNRNVSNVAPQALYLMNSPWVMQQAERTAVRLLQVPRAERLAHAYQLLFARQPSPREQKLAERFLARFAVDEQRGWATFVHTLIASLEFRYLD